MRSAATLDAWLGVTSGRTYLYVESTPDAPSSAWLSIEITSGIRTRGWVATDNAQGDGNIATAGIAVTRATSTMSDGLPDTWKNAHGLDANSSDPVNGPLGDADGDGIPNYRDRDYRPPNTRSTNAPNDSTAVISA